MTDVCNLLRLQRSFGCQGGVDDASIAQAETELGLRFSKDYHAYLKEMGCAHFYGHELTGLGCPSYIDVVMVTQAAREYYPDVPADCYVVEEAHIDGITYWQDASGAVYEAAPNGRPVKRHPSLAGYVGSMAESS